MILNYPSKVQNKNTKIDMRRCVCVYRGNDELTRVDRYLILNYNIWLDIH